MVNIPQVQARPVVSVKFDIGELKNKDWGAYYNKFEFKAILNGGYIVRGMIGDAQNNILPLLIKNGYLDKSRSKVLPIKFTLKASVEGKFPNTATKEQTAIVTSLHATGGPAPHNHIEFIAIDPASWYLNAGDASGEVFNGKISRVIKQVVAKYAPDINLEISETIDNDKNKFWMNRMDPKTFISSLIDWSSSVTKDKTHFILGMDGYKLIIKEQAELISKPRAYYKYWADQYDTIGKWDMLADNALSMIQTKILTQGLSATSGQYLDRITDEKETNLFVKDSTTPNKKIAEVTENESFTKPDDAPGAGPQRIGWSTVGAIPEVYSAGDMGLQYEKYIDGRARNLWLNLAPNILRIKVKVLGHGEWGSSIGLGYDTVYLKFINELPVDGPGKGAGITHFYNGNWMIYGFHHIIRRSGWYTNLYLCRHDHNAIAKKVGGAPWSA